MNAEKLSFLQHELSSLLRDIPEHTAGAWGKMNAQQMIEHLADFFDVSTEKIKFDLVTPAEHLPKYKEFLLGDKQFRENTKAPISVLGEEPLPLRTESIEEARQQLQKSVNEFAKYFENNDGKKTLHPVFGSLNYEEWILLHYKHVIHHLRQFGLNPQQPSR